VAHIVLGAYLLSGSPSYRQAGVHTYAKHLLGALSLSPLTPLPEGERNKITALLSPTALDELSTLHSPLSFRPASRTTENPFSRIFVEQIETPRVLRELNADLYHSLGFVAPLRAPCLTVVSMMDISFITQPRAHKLFNRVYLRLFSKASCRRAERVITISEHTKRDVVQHFGISPDRVDAIPLGVDHDHFKPQSPDIVTMFKAQHNIGDHAIFYLGSLEPRKNLPRLIEAFSLLTSHFPLLTSQLFIGGNLAWKYDEIFARIKQLGLQDSVKLIGRVSDDDLPKWYASCALTTYPSLYEGFGLPPLEAMACGAPVVTSNVTSLPEVVGDAGILVDPTDVNALSDALSRVLRDDDLRADMRAKSLARAHSFTWQRTAERTMESYRRVMG